MTHSNLGKDCQMSKSKWSYWNWEWAGKVAFILYDHGATIVIPFQPFPHL